MPHYRLYFPDWEDRISKAMDLECSSDDEAIEKATNVRHRHVTELWQGIRLVKRIEPSST